MIICFIVFSFFAGCSNANGHADDGDTASQQIPKPKPAPAPVDRFAWQRIAYDSTKQYIYLTFDDGPQHGTVTCFDLCKQQGIKATFFMVGLHAAQKTDGKKIVAMIKEGYPQFLLANHSYTHARDKYAYFYHHPAMAEQDFFQAQDSLHIPYRIIRLPGNSAWADSSGVKASGLVMPVTRRLDSAGYNVIGWDLEWGFHHSDARPVQSPEQLAREIDSAFAKHKTHRLNHLVVLTHDRMFQRPDDAQSLGRFISLLKKNPRYVFETIDHYPGVRIGR